MHAPTISTSLFILAVAGCAGPASTDPPRASGSASATVARPFPDRIALPNGFWPEGIDFGRATTFYVGSIATGAIFQGDARTGAGTLLVPANTERQNAGVEYDARRHRLFVAGGLTGQAYVYDASTGATLAVYQFADPSSGATLVNDVAILRDGAYFTDSERHVIYRVPLDPDGALAAETAVETVPLGGEFEPVAGAPAGNANGIVATPGESRVIVVNTTTGALYLVDPRTGHATTIPVVGGPFPGGDGLLLVGLSLYVVQGELDHIAVIRLAPDFASGVLERVITDPKLRYPSTVAAFGSALYVVNARFDAAPGPTVEYDVARLEP